MADAPRMQALDGVRGVAILMVIVMHCAQSVDIDTSIAVGGVDKAILALARYGWVGVDVFFALSGYLITRILLDTRGRAGYFATFYVRRSLRIFPLYFCFLAVALCLAWLQAPGGLFTPLLDEQPWLWTYLANWRSLATGDEMSRASSHLWSLSVEEQFYLLWPLVIYLTPPRRVLHVCLGVAAVALALRCALAWSGTDFRLLYVLTPTRVDPLVLGGALAAAMRQRSTPSWLRRNRWLAFVAMGLVAALPIARFLFSAQRWVVVLGTIGFSVIAMGATALLWLTLESPDGPMARALETAPLRKIGKHSYAIYLVQTPLIAALASRGLTVEHLPRAGGAIWPGFVLHIVIATVVALGISLVTWYLIETPFLRLKDRFRYSSR